MPAVKLWGRRWHFSSDILPLPACLAAAYHLSWLLVLLVGAGATDQWPGQCQSWEGKAYIALFSLMLAGFAVGLAVDALLFYHSLQGAPFEESKRRMVVPLLYAGTGPLVLLLLATVYGTWVVTSLEPDCWAEDVRDRLTNFAQALVFINWVFAFLTFLGAMIFFNMFPEHQELESWEQRWSCIATAFCCRQQMTRRPDGRRPPLKNIAELTAGLLSHVDLEPTDITAAVILTSAAQNRRRRLRIAKALMPVLRTLQGEDGTSVSGFDSSATEDQTDDGSDIDAVSIPEVPSDKRLTRELAALRASSLQAAAMEEGRQPAGAAPALQGARGRHVSWALEAPSLGVDAPSTPPLVPTSAPSLDLTEENVAALDTLGALQQASAGPSGAGGDGQVQAQTQAAAAVVASELEEILIDRAEAGAGPGAAAEVVDQLAEAVRSEVEQLGGGPMEESVMAVEKEASLDLTSVDIDPGEGAIWFRPSGSAAGASSDAGASDKAAHSAEPDALPTVFARSVSGDDDYAAAFEDAEADTNADTTADDDATQQVLQHQLTLLHPSVITPSEHVEAFAGPLSAEALADIYAGRHSHANAEELRQARRFLRYAYAVYSLQPSIEHPRSALDVACWRPPDPQVVVLRALGELEKVAADASIELLHLNCSNRVLAHLPYLIALDHDQRAVVIAIRGTISVADMVTDAVLYPEAVDDWLTEDMRQRVEGPALAHAGMAAAARAILRDMRERGILQELVDEEQPDEYTAPAQAPAPGEGGPGADAGAAGGGGAAKRERQYGGEADSAPAAVYQVGGRQRGDVVQPQHGGDAAASAAEGGGTDAEDASPGRQVGEQMRRKVLEEGWQLVVVGHSLGAGAAALLSLKLRRHFPHLRCLAYSCPGALVSRGLARAMAPFCTSVAVGKDAVPRANVATLGRLVDEMITALARCRQPKMRVLFAPWWRRHKQRFKELFYDYDEIPAEAAAVLVKYHESRRAQGQPVPMFPPGKVIFLRPIKTRRAKKWDAVHIAPEDLISEGILVSPHMLTDHLCSTAWEALNAALARAEAAEAAEERGGAQRRRRIRVPGWGAVRGAGGKLLPGRPLWRPPAQEGTLHQVLIYAD